MNLINILAHLFSHSQLGVPFFSAHHLGAIEHWCKFDNVEFINFQALGERIKHWWWSRRRRPRHHLPSNPSTGTQKSGNQTWALIEGGATNIHPNGQLKGNAGSWFWRRSVFWLKKLILGIFRGWHWIWTDPGILLDTEPCFAEELSEPVGWNNSNVPRGWTRW